MTEVIIPVRGGNHPIYGIYGGGSPLDDNYQPTRKGRLSYRSHMQRQNVKNIGTIEGALITARDSTTSLKFDGRLEPTVGSATEIGKDRFISLLARTVEDLGQETFYYVMNNSNEVVDLFEQSHNFTINAVVKEFIARKDGSLHKGAFDDYELDEIVMSRLVVESLLTATFYEKIVIRFGQREDFKDLPGSCLFLMALKTCNASVSYDVDKAETDFLALTLDTFPGENISDFATEAQRLVKKMSGGGPFIPLHTGSRLLIKVSKTFCEEFNRKIFVLLDSVKDMEYKYKMTDPVKMTKDPSYSEFGPYGLLLNIQQAYSRLLSFQDWPALATKLPQSNNASTSASNIKAIDGGGGKEKKCFRCGGDHHVRDCPKNKEKMDKDKDKSDANDDSHGPAKKAKTEYPAWRYLEPKDLTSTLVDDGCTWRFCTKCKCKKSGRIGLYILSHSDADHVDNWTPRIEGNLAAVDVPLNVPEATVSILLNDLDDDIEFQGLDAWRASVDPSGFTFLPSPVEREIDERCSTCDSAWSTFCVDCGIDRDPTFCIEWDSDEWDPSWLSEYEEWLLATKCPWPDSKSLLSDKALAYLRSVEPGALCIPPVTLNLSV